MESFTSPGSRASLSFEADLTELLRFFFQPVDLVFQLADLAVKFRFSLLQGFCLVVLFLREDLGKILEEGLLPLGYLVWVNAVNAVFRAYFRKCPLFPKCFKYYLGLECRIVSLSPGCICSLPEFVPPGLSYHLRPWSSFRGVAPKDWAFRASEQTYHYRFAAGSRFLKSTTRLATEVQCLHLLLPVPRFQQGPGISPGVQAQHPESRSNVFSNTWRGPR